MHRKFFIIHKLPFAFFSKRKNGKYAQAQTTRIGISGITVLVWFEPKNLTAILM